MALTDNEIIVGKAIKPRIKLAVIIFCFAGAPILTKIGPITIKPKAPKTTEGMPDNNSTKVKLIFLIFFGKNSQINKEVKIPKGIAKIIENKQTQNVAVIKGKIPNEGLSSVGDHLLPINILIKPNLWNAEIDSAITKAIKAAKSSKVKVKKK